MALPNSEKITSQLATLPDQALKQMAMMHKADPYILPLIISEDGRRKQMRQAAQAQMAGMPQPKVADAAVAQMGVLPEEQGIGALPAPNMQSMADGGIAGYGDDANEGMAAGGSMFDFAQRSEPVLRMAGGGVPGYAKGDAIKIYEDRIRAEALRQGVDPDLAVRLFTQESAGNKNAVSSKGAAGLGQLMIPAAKEMGLKPNERFDPEKNIPASIGYLKKQLVKYEGDPEKALAAYNWGAGNVDKHLAKNEGKLNRIGLPKETADYLTKILPMGSARAEDVPQATTPTAAKERYLTGNQGVIGTGETALQYLTGALAIPTAGGAAVLEQLPNVFSGKGADRAEMEKSFREKAGQVTYTPRTEGGRTISEGFGQTLEDLKIPPYLARIGAGTPKGPGARPSAEGIAGIAEQMKQAAAEKKAAVSTPRLEPPRAEKPTMVVDSEGRAMPADTRARVGAAFDDQAAAAKAAQDAAAWEKAAQEAKNAPDFSKYAGAMDEGQLEAARARGISALAGVTPSTLSAQKSTANVGAAPQTEDQSAAETARLLRQNDLLKNSKPEDIVDAAKEVTPAKERKGFDNEDLLTLGLSLMANKSPRFLTALGEAGIQTLGAKREREKSETDKLYRDALIKQAERPAAEVQLIERYQKDPKFREAYDMFAQSKREPQTRESLLKSWAASPFLQTTYTNPEDYIKMMSAAAGGGASGSQLNASDQSLIQKYLLR